MKTIFLLKWIVMLFVLYQGADLHGQYNNMKFVLQQTYTATRNGKEIGWMRMTCYQKDNELLLITESDLTIQMIISFEAKATTENKFNGNTLLQAGVHRTLNNRVKLDNVIQLMNGEYLVMKGEGKSPVKKLIGNTSTSIYFKEPVGVSEVFSEVYLCFIKLSKIATSVYQALLPDGGIMTYYYEFGKLVQITAKTNYATIDFNLKQ